ncbi:MAG: alpha/beta hydrolase [Henriciella sp.]
MYSRVFLLLCLSLLSLIMLSACSVEKDQEPSVEPQAELPIAEQVTDPALEYANRNVDDGLYFSEGYFAHNGHKLHYVEAGEGDLVILYHGFPSFWFSFYDQAVALKRDYRVVVVDGLGAGLSDKPDDLSAYKLSALIEHVDALAHHLNGDVPITLIGHDWGGALALAFAESKPDRLNAVVAMNAPSFNVFLELLRSNEQQQKTSTYMAVMSKTSSQSVRDNPPGDGIWKSAYGGLLGRGELTQEEYELFGLALRPASATNGGFNWYRANVPLPDQIRDADFFPVPPREITVPALLIWGTEDRAFVPEFIPMLSDASRDLEVVTIEGANHWTLMSHSAETTAAIQSFLSRTEEQN